MDWSNFRPEGESKITFVPVRCKLSTASKIGSGFSNIPGPPPNGRSSTVLCRSCVQSRRLWIFKSSKPDLRARMMMLSSSGPANIAGNKVSTSIFISRRRCSRHKSLVFDDLDRATHALLGAAGLQERTDGIDRRALAADDLAHVRRIQAQFI